MPSALPFPPFLFVPSRTSYSPLLHLRSHPPAPLQDGDDRPGILSGIAQRCRDRDDHLPRPRHSPLVARACRRLFRLDEDAQTSLVDPLHRTSTAVYHGGYAPSSSRARTSLAATIVNYKTEQQIRARLASTKIVHNQSWMRCFAPLAPHLISCCRTRHLLQGAL
ncbi:hypothetical protein K438DRAFT_1954172 [Mycena galopus ATCC 62051]|nr:hypothetical protein K438DRAFT_1954172 [Mycena galopus ATCC 62051]